MCAIFSHPESTWNATAKFPFLAPFSVDLFMLWQEYVPRENGTKHALGPESADAFQIWNFAIERALGSPQIAVKPLVSGGSETGQQREAPPPSDSS